MLNSKIIGNAYSLIPLGGSWFIVPCEWAITTMKDSLFLFCSAAFIFSEVSEHDRNSSGCRWNWLVVYSGASVVLESYGSECKNADCTYYWLITFAKSSFFSRELRKLIVILSWACYSNAWFPNCWRFKEMVKPVQKLLCILFLRSFLEARACWPSSGGKCGGVQFLFGSRRYV